MSLTRRELLRTGTALLALTPLAAEAAPAEIVDVRLWPAQSYTRVTIEHTAPIRFKYFMVRSPKPIRLVIDIKDLKFTKRLQQMLSRVSPKDPYISAIRCAQYQADTVRIVMDLKKDAVPELFQSEPNSKYRYRLIFDIHPAGYEPDVVAKEIQKYLEEPDAPAPSKQAPKPAQQSDQSSKRPQDKKSTSTGKNRQKKSKEKIVVVIDPGHGGEDPGAVGRRGTYEKHVTLAIARKLRAIIQKDSAYTSVMTRTSDIFVPLGQRVRIAVRNKAHVFVSIHADAWINPSAKGASVFALAIDKASSANARWLAQTQNEADKIGGVKLDNMNKKGHQTFIDMNAEWKTIYSLELGHCILRNLEKVNTLHNKKIEQAQFLVLKSPGIPSVLVESAFISNPAEERKLRTSSYQQKVAQAIFQGIKEKVRQEPPLRIG